MAAQSSSPEQQQQQLPCSPAEPLGDLTPTEQLSSQLVKAQLQWEQEERRLEEELHGLLHPENETAGQGDNTTDDTPLYTFSHSPHC